MPNRAPKSSYKALNSFRCIFDPSIKFCSIWPCICCGYISPFGVGTGFCTPSAVTPTITNLPVRSGKLDMSIYSYSLNTLLKRIYAVPSGCVTIGSKGGTANSCIPMSLVFNM